MDGSQYDYQIKRKEVDIMENITKLTELVKESGIKRSFLAEKMGLSMQGYLNKEYGKSKFNSEEIKVLKDVLHLSPKQLDDLFFS